MHWLGTQSQGLNHVLFDIVSMTGVLAELEVGLDYSQHRVHTKAVEQNDVGKTPLRKMVRVQLWVHGVRSAHSNLLASKRPIEGPNRSR